MKDVSFLVGKTDGLLGSGWENQIENRPTPSGYFMIENTDLNNVDHEMILEYRYSTLDKDILRKRLS